MYKRACSQHLRIYMAKILNAKVFLLIKIKVVKRTEECLMFLYGFIVFLLFFYLLLLCVLFFISSYHPENFQNVNRIAKSSYRRLGIQRTRQVIIIISFEFLCVASKIDFLYHLIGLNWSSWNN